MLHLATEDFQILELTRSVDCEGGSCLQVPEDWTLFEGPERFQASPVYTLKGKVLVKLKYNILL